MSKRKTLDDCIMDYARNVGAFTAWDIFMDVKMPEGRALYSINSIHSALSRLYRAWCLERVSRGVYRLRKEGDPPPHFIRVCLEEKEAVDKWQEREEKLKKAVRRKVKL